MFWLYRGTKGQKNYYGDEDGGYSLMMNSFLYDGYTCSIVFLHGTRFIVCGLGGEAVDGRQCII